MLHGQIQILDDEMYAIIGLADRLEAHQRVRPNLLGSCRRDSGVLNRSWVVAIVIDPSRSYCETRS